MTSKRATGVREDGMGAVDQSAVNICWLVLCRSESSSEHLHLYLKSWSYKLNNQVLELLCCSDSWMKETMQWAKYGVSPCRRNYRALCFCGYLIVEGVDQWDCFQDEDGSLEKQRHCMRWSIAIALGLSHSSKVYYTAEHYSLNTREYIGLWLNMMDGGGELRYVV